MTVKKIPVEHGAPKMRNTTPIIPRAVSLNQPLIGTGVEFARLFLTLITISPKQPWFLLTKNSSLVDLPHLLRASVANVTCVLLHYPFLSSFYTKVMDAVKIARYALSASFEYEMYWQRLRDDPDLQLLQSTSLKLNSVNDLVDQSFLIASEKYIAWVNTPSYDTANPLLETLKAN